MRIDLLRHALTNHLHLLNAQRQRALQLLEGTVSAEKAAHLQQVVEEKICDITETQCMLNELQSAEATVSNNIKYLIQHG